MTSMEPLQEGISNQKFVRPKQLCASLLYTDIQHGNDFCRFYTVLLVVCGL
jgi:hypothetical protein